MSTEFTVSKVLERKVVAGKVFYLVKWLGYAEPTLELADNCAHCFAKVADLYLRSGYTKSGDNYFLLLRQHIIRDMNTKRPHVRNIPMKHSMQVTYSYLDYSDRFRSCGFYRRLTGNDFLSILGLADWNSTRHMHSFKINTAFHATVRFTPLFGVIHNVSDLTGTLAVSFWCSRVPL